MVTIFNLAHLPWINLPHCTHKAEFAFALKLQTPHGSILLLDKPSFVMPLLSITLVFSRLSSKPLLSTASFHFKNLLLSPSIVSLIGTKSSACKSHLAQPLAISVMISITTAKRKGDSTDPWCISALTSNSSDNS